MALCAIENVPDSTVAKDTTAIAIICKVSAASKPEQHAADLYIEAMEVVPKEQIDACGQMMRQLYRVSDMPAADLSSESAWQQRKCRRLLRYPTIQQNTKQNCVVMGQKLATEQLLHIITLTNGATEHVFIQ